MAFRTGAYAAVWEVIPSTNYTDVRISTSRKRKDTGEYETDFQGRVRFIGEAHKRIGQMDCTKPDRGPIFRIRLGDVSATQTYDKERDKNWVNFQVYSFEEPDQNQPVSTQRAPQKFDPSISDDVEEDELPFN